MAYDVVLHIGAPKAGTSALQKFLVTNRARLEEQGYHYPHHTRDVNDVSGGHATIGNALMDGQVKIATDRFNRFLSEARSHGLCLLLSSESFFQEAPRLRFLTGGLQTQVISYYRDPLSAMLSSYNQSTKRHFNTSSLEDFYRKRMTENAKRYTSAVYAEDWMEYFEQSDVLVLPYHEPSFPETRIELSFLNALGIAPSDWNRFSYTSKRINRSYSTEHLELKRLLNKVLDADAYDLNREVDLLLQSHSDRATDDVSPSLQERIGLELYVEMVEEFAASVVEMKTRYLSYVPDGFPPYPDQPDAPYRQVAPSVQMDPLRVATEAFQSDSDLCARIRLRIESELKKGRVDGDLIVLARLFDVEQVRRCHMPGFIQDTDSFNDD